MIFRCFLIVFLTLGAHAQESFLEEGTANKTPKELEGVGITEHLGEKIDLSTKFRNEEGKEVPLSTYFDGKRPVLLTLIYYSCPSLCNFHLNGLTDVFKQLDKWEVGKQFDVVAISINPKEQADVAKAKKASYIEEYGKPQAASGWHFLTGRQESIDKIAKQIGFQYKWVEETQEYAHSAAAYVISPDGMISRYLYGIGFAPKTLRLSLVEAADGKIGTVLDRFILYCFQYDPDKKSYAFYAYNVMRAGAGFSAIVLLLFLAAFWVRQRKK
tara:strand:- start:8897 stop:9709 length:813 start_codon:yes stop_codon:yes gene_type:complete